MRKREWLEIKRCLMDPTEANWKRKDAVFDRASNRENRWLMVAYCVVVASLVTVANLQNSVESFLWLAVIQIGGAVITAFLIMVCAEIIGCLELRKYGKLLDEVYF